MKKMNNKGFSLVELIIVIAIMAVLIGVMAPQFLKYVEQSRRSTDITNAQSIATAIQADIADGEIQGSVALTEVKGDGSTALSIVDKPQVRGNLVTGTSAVFKYSCNAATGEVIVKVGGYELYPGITSVMGAEAYKTAK